MIHHGCISSDSEMKGGGGGGGNVRQRHSVDWHLIESGRGAFDCASCQYQVIVFLTYMVPSIFCGRVDVPVCLSLGTCINLRTGRGIKMITHSTYLMGSYIMATLTSPP